MSTKKIFYILYSGIILLPMHKINAMDNKPIKSPFIPQITGKHNTEYKLSAPLKFNKEEFNKEENEEVLSARSNNSNGSNNENSEKQLSIEGNPNNAPIVPVFLYYQEFDKTQLNNIKKKPLEEEANLLMNIIINIITLIFKNEDKKSHLDLIIIMNLSLQMLTNISSQILPKIPLLLQLLNDKSITLPMIFHSASVVDKNGAILEKVSHWQLVYTVPKNNNFKKLEPQITFQEEQGNHVIQEKKSFFGNKETAKIETYQLSSDINSLLNKNLPIYNINGIFAKKLIEYVLTQQVHNTESCRSPKYVYMPQINQAEIRAICNSLHKEKKNYVEIKNNEQKDICINISNVLNLNENHILRLSEYNKKEIIIDNKKKNIISFSELSIPFVEIHINSLY